MIGSQRHKIYRVTGFALLLAAPAAAREPATPVPVVRSVAIRGAELHVALATQVGQPYDGRSIEKDVRYLWGLGRFEDVRVEAAEEDSGTSVIFRVTPRPPLRLHAIRIQPPGFGVGMSLPEGTPMDPLRAHEIALEARKQLRARGYTDARVREELAPFEGKEVDLKLTIEAGAQVRVRTVEFVGDPVLPAGELRSALRGLRIRRALPGVPHLWTGWRLDPSYSQDAVDADVTRLESLYLSKGYLDASVRTENVEIHGSDARVRIAVEAGPRYAEGKGAGAERPRKDLCPCLLAARRGAERAGILDFAVNLEVRRIEDGPRPIAEMTAAIDRGRPYRVGRIDFTGNHHYSDAVLRRHFLLDEGAWFDERLLRRSIARLNRMGLFENIDERGVAIRQNEATGTADVSVRLTERKRGDWHISGPVGPMSLAGPLQASISSRLPAWGRGLFELSTYTVSLRLFAFAQPILPWLSMASHQGFLPVVALERPYTPGEGWRSGFAIAPQVGWRALGIGYGATQVVQRLLPLLAGEGRLEPALAVTVKRPAGDAMMLCEARRPRLAPLRTAAAFALQFVGGVTGL